MLRDLLGIPKGKGRRSSKQRTGQATAACTRTHVPQDRLQCPLHACLHGTAQACTQLCSSKLRSIYPAHFAHTKDSCRPDTDCASKLREDRPSSGNTICLFPLCSHSPTPLGTICTQKHSLWGSPGTGEAQHPRAGTQCLSSLHMPQLAQPAPTPHFLFTYRDSALTESSSNIISPVEQ